MEAKYQKLVEAARPLCEFMQANYPMAKAVINGKNIEILMPSVGVTITKGKCGIKAVGNIRR